jgi:hypothetical protein
MTEPDSHETLRRLERKVETVISLLIMFVFIYVFDRLYDKHGLVYAIGGIVVVAVAMGAIYWRQLGK